MLYHPQSPYYRQFLTASTKQKKKIINDVIQQKSAQAMNNVNPGSVGLWVKSEN